MPVPPKQVQPSPGSPASSCRAAGDVGRRDPEDDRVVDDLGVARPELAAGEEGRRAEPGSTRKQRYSSVPPFGGRGVYAPRHGQRGEPLPDPRAARSTRSARRARACCRRRAPPAVGRGRAGRGSAGPGRGRGRAAAARPPAPPPAATSRRRMPAVWPGPVLPAPEARSGVPGTAGRRRGSGRRGARDNGGMAQLRIALAQVDTTVGDLAGNAETVLTWSRAAADDGADLVLFPEMALTGYPPEDLVFRESFRSASVRARDELARAAGRGRARRARGGRRLPRLRRRPAQRLRAAARRPRSPPRTSSTTCPTTASSTRRATSCPATGSSSSGSAASTWR